jgi:MFS family permease
LNRIDTTSKTIVLKNQAGVLNMKLSGRLSNPKTRDVISLGVVSFFNDLSSEVIARVLPLYLLTVVHTSVMGIGFVEAIADGTAVFAKLFAGLYSDRLKRRKPFVFAGYAISVLSRPLIVVAPILSVVSISRFLDKVGKGVRTAPRDALVADLSTENNRGFHYGITRSLDTLGAVLGLAVVAIVLTYTPATVLPGVVLRQILLWASVVGIFALIVLWLGVSEAPMQAAQNVKKQLSFSFDGIDSRLRFYLFIAFIFALASSSDAFIIVRAKEFGLSLRDIFLVLSGFNIISAVSAYYLSDLSDRLGRKMLLASGWFIYAISYGIFGMASLTLSQFIIAACCYGLFYGLTDGVEKAMVADFEGEQNKGKAFGLLGFVNGVGIIPANLIFGYFYKSSGFQVSFWFSGGLALIGAVLLLTLKVKKQNNA